MESVYDRVSVWELDNDFDGPRFGNVYDANSEEQAFGYAVERSSQNEDTLYAVIGWLSMNRYEKLGLVWGGRVFLPRAQS